MNLIEKNGNLFTLSKKDYVFAHCISTDLLWGMGIAPEMMKEFKCSSHWRPATADRKYNVGDIGVNINNTGIVVHLFTKSVYYGKPTINTVRACLVNLCNWMKENNYNKLAIPRIGCGLDKLSWAEVRSVISDVFKDSDIEITVMKK